MIYEMIVITKTIKTVILMFFFKVG